ncbi:MAG: ion channel [Cyanobacteria bacterium J06638_6]
MQEILCVYFLFGVVWALLYALVEATVPGSYSNVSATADIDLFMYYSLVTLTTLGYGDIAPLLAPAQSLAAMEAFVGQIYLAVIIARLIGLHMKET